MNVCLMYLGRGAELFEQLTLVSIMPSFYANRKRKIVMFFQSMLGNSAHFPNTQ